MPSPNSPKRIPIGRIVSAHGIKGEVKVEPFTEYLERFDPGETLFVGEVGYTIKACRLQGRRLLIGFKEVNDRNTAERLQWATLEGPAASRPELEEDEFLSKDLLGMRVVTEEGEVIGEVESVLPYPAHDLIVVGNIQIPAVKEFIRSVDIKARRMVVRLLEGMRPD